MRQQTVQAASLSSHQAAASTLANQLSSAVHRQSLLLVHSQPHAHTTLFLLLLPISGALFGAPQLFCHCCVAAVSALSSYTHHHAGLMCCVRMQR